MPERQSLTAEGSLDFARIGEVQVSPDGSRIAFVVGEMCRPDAEHPARSRIWMATVDGDVRPFTSGIASDHTPRWSPDGSRLAFLSDRDGNGKTAMFLLDIAGGEATPLGNLPGSPMALEWSADGSQLAFLMDDPETAAAGPNGESSDAIVVEGHHAWRRLWVIDIVTGVARRITDGDLQVWEYTWATDGSFVLVAGAEPYEWSWFLASLMRIGPEGDAPTTIYHVPEKQYAAPRVAPDGRHVVFLSAIWSDRGMNAGDLLLLQLADGMVRNLSAGYGGSIWWMQWTDDGSGLDFLAYEQGEAVLGRIALADGSRTIRWRGAFQFDEDFASRYLLPDGSLAVVRSDPLAPAELWLLQVASEQPAAAPPPVAQPAAQQLLWEEIADVAADQAALWSADALPAVIAAPPLHWRRLSRVQPPIDDIALGETRTLVWRGSDGTPVQGLLVLPVGYEEGRAYPLVTWVHGGPAWFHSYAFQGSGRSVAQLFAGQGYAVLLPNPRGSIGWGVPFTEATIGDYGGGDYADIMAGIDHVIAMGIAAADRLAIGGWSYGGYMSAWAITQTTRFRLALIGAAITHWRSFHGVASIGTWDRIGLRADPYTPGNLYDTRSPLHYANQIATPALIVHGQNDIIVPVGQAYELFRAMKDRGITAELVIYPREPHGLQERAHVLDRTQRYLAWLAQYL